MIPLGTALVFVERRHRSGSRCRVNAGATKTLPDVSLLAWSKAIATSSSGYVAEAISSAAMPPEDAISMASRMSSCVYAAHP